MLGRLDKMVVLVTGIGGGRSMRVAQRESQNEREEEMFDVACSLPLDFLFATCPPSELKWEKTGGFIMGGEPEPDPKMCTLYAFFSIFFFPLFFFFWLLK